MQPQHQDSTMAPPSLPSYLDPDVLPKLLENVNEHVQALSSGDLKARDAAIEACRTLASTLESPSEAFVRMTWVEVGSRRRYPELHVDDYHSPVIFRPCVLPLEWDYSNSSRPTAPRRRAVLSLQPYAQLIHDWLVGSADLSDYPHTDT